MAGYIPRLGVAHLKRRVAMPLVRVCYKRLHSWNLTNQTMPLARVCCVSYRRLHSWNLTKQTTTSSSLLKPQLGRELISTPTVSLQRCRWYTSAPDGFKVVYVAPLKGAVRAVKMFSLTTAVAAFFGGPTLVWLGNPSVPVVGRVAISSLVMLVGISTTAILHWLLKGYVMQLQYNKETQTVAVYTLSLIARKKRNEFLISEAGPPPSVSGFSTFQAKGKSYFMHTDVFEDKKLLSAMLGAHSILEDKDTWNWKVQNSEK